MRYLFGVDYYPEHWPKQRWAVDARMMHEMGIRIVRMGEFSWSKWEPSEGDFRFEDLDEAIDILGKEGIDCILGTPSAAPPAWIIAQAPDIQPIDSRGHVRHFGGRHHDCQSNPVYRAHIRRFVTAYASHFAHNPHVVGWQVDNELGNSHGDLCFCERCEARFRAWLKEKYGDIGELNACWGTCFWGQDYADFDRITAPKETVTGYNPGQLLDWKRFCSDLVLDFHRFQADIIREISPDKFITHNMMGFSDKVSYYQLGEQLDFAGQDNYPSGHFLPRHDGFRADAVAAELDFIRSVKQKPFWVMEEQSGITGWEILGRTPAPGQLRLWAMQCFAHGADTLLFFRWRSCTVGTEQYWHGILPHDGIPGRYYREIKQMMAQEAPLLRLVQGSMPKNDTAILFSYEQTYAFQIQPHHPQMTYLQHLMTYYRALFAKHIPTDFVSDRQDWSAYKVLIAPLQFLITPEQAERFKRYVENGGTLVLTMRSGVKDAFNRCFQEQTLPCLLNDLCGLTVSEYDCLRDTTGSVSWDGQTYECECWSDILSLTTAAPLAVYDSMFYRGAPAIACNRFGVGRVYYVGTQMSEQLALRFVDELCRTAALRSLMDAPPVVEAACRVSSDTQYLFVMNHSDMEQPIRLDDSWTLKDNPPPVSIRPYDVLVLTRLIQSC